MPGLQRGEDDAGKFVGGSAWQLDVAQAASTVTQCIALSFELGFTLLKVRGRDKSRVLRVPRRPSASCL